MIRELFRHVVDLAATKLICTMIGHQWGLFSWCVRCGAIHQPLPPPSISLDE